MPDLLTLMAPLSGVVVQLEDVPDPVFAQRMVGDGISIDPMSDRVLAPCDARIIQVHRANHAVTLSAAGLEIMIHVGIDTVGLKGDGFTAVVKTGDDVKAGDVLLKFDADRVALRARSLLTQVLVTTMDRVASLEGRSGKVVAGRDVLLKVRLASASKSSGSASAPSASAGATAESRPIRIAAEHGLHARPAALLAAAARQFTADVRLVKGSQDANVRSVVSILALEVAAGDTVTIVARGPDAADAVAALTKTLTTDIAAEPPAPPSFDSARPTVVHGQSDTEFRGVSASPGVAIGQIVQFRHDDVVPEERAADANHERRALDSAIAAAHVQLEALQTRIAAGTDAEQASIFAAHQELLEDPEVLDRAASEIRGGASAAFAWKQAYSAQADRLFGLKSQLLAGRAADLRDVGRRVLHLLVGQSAAPQEMPPDSIVVAEDLAPSDAASLDRTRVRGFCTTMGTATSHAAILARGLGIPAVAGIDPRVLDLAPGTRVVLDGDAGTLKVAPTAAEEAQIVKRQAAGQLRRSQQMAVATEPATTRDGHRVKVVVNLGDVSAASDIATSGGEGVGLLRTEFLFMERRLAPDEDEQTAAYEEILRHLGPNRDLVVRTLDVGGDKPLSYLPIAPEANPFLGERGIRFTNNQPELFRAQVRAILRASRSGKVAVMFPMIATLAEWRAARALVERERAELGVPPLEIGIMVETPAAAVLADTFAREADFLSIGTNDLTQYVLAMDRSNPRLAPQMDPMHPAVLWLIERTAIGAHAHRRWAGVCGALAGDLAAIPILVGLGVDELSVDVPIVPAVKARIRELSLAECRITAQEALKADDGEAVRRLVARRHQ